MTQHPSPPAIPDSIWKKPSHFIAFGFGSGALPYAPGTWGTLLAIPFYLVLRTLSPASYLVALVFIILGSIWLCDKTSKEIGVHDHPGMCIDEFVGYFVTMYNAPHRWTWIFWGFVLFRLFDIWKPWPIRAIDEKITGGLGIVLDDVLAGIYSCIVLHILMQIF